MEKKTILIAEDDKNINELLKTSLESFGYKIIQTSNGEDACMGFVKQSPDLIILDILMPKMNGFKVCEWIRSRPYKNDVPIIMISGVYRKKEQQEEALNKLGANDFLIKPFRMDHLIERIRFHLDKKVKVEVSEEEEDIIFESETTKFSLVGNLSEKPIEALLHLLFIERETGKLVLRKNKLRIHFFFKNGNLVFAQSNIKKLTLAHYFYEAQKLTAEQYKSTEILVKKKKLSREEAIRSLGYLSDEEIKIGMSLLFQDIVYMAFRWEAGDYYFIKHREPASNSWQLLQSTANLIFGGIRRIADLDRINDRLPDENEILRKSQNPLLRFQNISLKSEEKEILNLVDGKKTFGTIENTGSLIHPKARNILYGLLETGLIEVFRKAGDVADELSGEEDFMDEDFIEAPIERPSIKISHTGGNLLIEPLPGILFQCFQSSFTGEVNFDDGEAEKVVLFQDGNIVYARSSKDDDRLGNVLFELGRLDHKLFAKALRVQSKEKKKKIGTILLDLGFLTKDQLKLALQFQVKKIVLDIFTWSRGSYLIKEKKITESAEVSISINTLTLIMEAIREIKDTTRIKRFLPRDDVPLELAENIENLEHFFDFTEGERQILKMVDGTRTFSDLTNMFKIGRMNIFGFFYGLYAMKLVHIVHREKVPVYTSDRGVEEATLFEEERHLEEDLTLNFDEPEQEIPVFEEKPLFETDPVRKPESSSPQEPQRAQQAESWQKKQEKVIDERVSMQDMVDEYYNIIKTGDYYRILKVTRESSAADIKLSFRKLAKQFHPDTIYKTGVNFTHDVLNEIFITINEAYQTLNNKTLREQYDREQPDVRPDESVEDLRLRAEMAFSEGVKQVRNGQPLEAADHFREAIRLFPNKALYHTRLVEAYLDAQVPARRVIRSALEAVRIDTSFPDSHYVLARVYYELKDFNKTREEINKTLELEPQHERALKLQTRVV